MKALTDSHLVEKCRERIYATLEEHCKRVHPDEPARFAKLLLRLPSLRSIGLKCLEHLFFRKLLGDTPVDSFLDEVLNAAVAAHGSPMEDTPGLFVSTLLDAASTRTFPITGIPQYISTKTIPGSALLSATNGFSSSSVTFPIASGASSRFGVASSTNSFLPQQQYSPRVPLAQSSAQLLASPSGDFTFPSPSFPLPARVTDSSSAHGLDLYAAPSLSSTAAISPTSGTCMQATTSSTHTWTRHF